MKNLRYLFLALFTTVLVTSVQAGPRSPGHPFGKDKSVTTECQKKCDAKKECCEGKEKADNACSKEKAVSACHKK